MLDSGSYEVDLEPGAITMTSAPDPRTGLRFTRRFELRDNGYLMRLGMRNVGADTVRWALWNVTQLPAGEVRIGMSRLQVVDLVAGTGNPRWGVDGDDVVVPVQEVVGKLGFPGTTGWFTHTRDGVRLTQRFEVDPGAEYPDHGSPLEVWIEHPLPRPLASLGDLDPPAHIVECEVLGPLTTLAPGESASLTCAVEVLA